MLDMKKLSIEQVKQLATKTIENGSKTSDLGVECAFLLKDAIGLLEQLQRCVNEKEMDNIIIGENSELFDVYNILAHNALQIDISTGSK